MRTRRDFLAAGVAGLLAAPFRVLGQARERVWRVGVLAPSRRPDTYGAFVQGLRDLGYVEGGNLVIEWRFADGAYERLPGLAEELVRLPIDVIVTDGSPGARAAMKATSTIPIAFVVGDALSAGLVKSLARPGGNATGISVFGKDIAVKQVDLLRGFVPRLSRVALLSNPDNPSHLENLKNFRAATEATGVAVLSREARTPQQIEEAISALSAARAGAFILLADPFFNQQLRQVAELTTKNRLPSISLNPVYAEVGGLASYGSRGASNWRALATMAHKIFTGVRPGDIPVEQPTKLELVVNRKTARALGLAIPPELLLLADRVIE